MYGRNASKAVLYYSHFEALPFEIAVVVLLIKLKMFKSEKFGEIQPQNMLKLKKLIVGCMFCCQATSEKQGCNQGSNAILGSRAEKSIAAQDDLATSEAVR